LEAYETKKTEFLENQAKTEQLLANFQENTYPEPGEEVKTKQQKKDMNVKKTNMKTNMNEIKTNIKIVFLGSCSMDSKLVRKSKHSIKNNR